MFDGMINAAKGYFPDRFVFFAVTAAVGTTLWQLITVGEGFDPMLLAQMVVSFVVGTLLATMIVGASE